MFEYLFCELAGHDGTCGRMKLQGGVEALERTAVAQFYKAKLRHGHLEGGQRLVLLLECQLDGAGHIGVEAIVFFVIWQVVFDGLQVFKGHIIGNAGKIVLVDQSEATGKTEDDLTFHFLLRTERQHLKGGVALGGSRKETGECQALGIQLVEHQLKLLLILWHVVCLTRS